MIIYKTTNLVNGKIYVGKDCNDNPSYLGSGKIFKQAVKKYGRENFKKEVLEVCDLSNICEREIFWISKLNARDRNVGYNILVGGTGIGFGKDSPWFGKHCSAEHREKISRANKGKIYSPETLARMSMAQKGKKGAVRSESCRRKISLAHKGRLVSVEARLNMSKAQRGKVLTEEHKRKIGLSSKGRIPSADTRLKRSLSLKGRIFSPEHCQRIAAAKKGKKLSTETKLKMSLASRHIGGMLGKKHSEATRLKMSMNHKSKRLHRVGEP